jgi:hypothetical protein
MFYLRFGQCCPVSRLNGAGLTSSHVHAMGKQMHIPQQQQQLLPCSHPKPINSKTYENTKHTHHLHWTATTLLQSGS